MRGAPGNRNLNLPYTLALGLQASAGAQRRLQHEHRFALPRLALDDPPGRPASNFLVGVPQKNQVTAQGKFQRPQSVHCKQRDHQPALHIKRAGSKRPSARHPQRHSAQRAFGVDRVQMSEYQNRAQPVALFGDQLRANVIAAQLLRQCGYPCAAPPPFVRHALAYRVHRRFVVARRLDRNEIAEQVNHSRQTQLQIQQQFPCNRESWCHGARNAISATIVWQSAARPVTLVSDKNCHFLDSAVSTPAVTITTFISLPTDTTRRPRS